MSARLRFLQQWEVIRQSALTSECVVRIEASYEEWTELADTLSRPVPDPSHVQHLETLLGAEGYSLLLGLACTEVIYRFDNAFALPDERVQHAAMRVLNADRMGTHCVKGRHFLTLYFDNGDGGK